MLQVLGVLFYALGLLSLVVATWAGSDVTSFQIRFDEPADKVRRVLKEEGFDPPAVGQLRNAPAENRLGTAIGIEELPQGSAMTCAAA